MGYVLVVAGELLRAASVAYSRLGSKLNATLTLRAYTKTSARRSGAEGADTFRSEMVARDIFD